MLRQFAIILLTFISLIVIGYQLYLESQYQKFEVNKNTFMIKKDVVPERKNETLQTLVEIRQRMDKLVDHLQKKYPNDALVSRLQQRFDGTILKENNYDPSDPTKSSYTVNKGDVMVLCLREKKMTDLNTLMYVAIHELGHIYSSSLNHTKEFWKNMAFLEREAKEIGIYEIVDYSKNPVRYCGMTIASNNPKHE